MMNQEQYPPSQVQMPSATNVWMPKPEGSVGCPQGLEYLNDLEGLVFRQFMGTAPGQSGIPVGSNSWYKIENFMGQQIYFGIEETSMDAVCCPGQRGYSIHISDNLGSEVMRISRAAICCSCCPCCGCDHLIEIEAPVGNTIGYVKSRKTFLVPLFVITDASDEELFSITFPLCANASPTSQEMFSIVPADGSSDVAVVTKPYGRAEFPFRLKDYNLKFPLKLDVKNKALLSACIFVIDAMFYPPLQRLNVRGM